MHLWALLLGCELTDLIEPSNDVNRFDRTQIVAFQLTPPVITPGDVVFLDLAVANPDRADLRAFVFGCLPSAPDCGDALGLPQAEVVLDCHLDREVAPCLDLRSTTTGFRAPDVLETAFATNPNGPAPIEIPWFVAVCETGACPSELTDPVESPVLALGLDGSRPPPPDLDTRTLRIAVRPVLARLAPEPGDVNPTLRLPSLPESEVPAGETTRFDVVVEGGARRNAGLLRAFTTGGRFTTAAGGSARLAQRGETIRFELTMPSPAEPTAVWVVLENGSGSGTLFSWTYLPSDPGER